MKVKKQNKFLLEFALPDYNPARNKHPNNNVVQGHLTKNGGIFQSDPHVI